MDYISMRSLIRNWWWGGDPDEPNPVSGLSRRDIHIIQNAWSPIYADAGKYGLELFIRLFRADPSTKTFFKIVQNMNESQMSHSYQFRAHTINLMSSVNMAVLNLHQPEVVIAMMHKLGESHHKRNIKKKHFYEVKEVFIGMLKNDLKLKQERIIAWNKFVTFIYRHIFEKLEENL